MDEFYVEVRRWEGDSCVKRMGPMSEAKADKVADGVSINLDHENYYVHIHEGSDGLVPVET